MELKSRNKNYFLNSRNYLKNISSQNGIFDFKQIFNYDSLKPYSIYLMFSVECDTHRTAYLISNLCQKGKIYFNKKLINKIDFTRNNAGKSYSNYDRVFLKKGINYFTAKIELTDFMTVKQFQHFDFKARLVSHDIAKKYYSDNFRFDFVKNSLLSTSDDSLRLYFPFINMDTVNISINNKTNIFCINKEDLNQIIIPSNKLIDGINNINLRFDSTNFSQKVHKGDIPNFNIQNISIHAQNVVFELKKK